MSCWSLASVCTNQFIPLPAASTKSFVNIKSCNSFICSPSQGRCCLSDSENHHGVRRLRLSGIVKARQGLTHFQEQQGTWENPDDGSGSESDDEEEETEDENYGFESDWEEEETTPSAVNGVISVDKYGEDIKTVTFCIPSLFFYFFLSLNLIFFLL